MNTATKLSGFALGLVAVLGAAYGAGQVTGPVTPAESGHATTGHPTAGPDGSAAPSGHGDGHEDAGGGGPEDAPTGGDSHLPGGLLVSDRGYALTPVSTPVGEFAFRVTGPDGHVVTGFDESHDKRMHLVVARRDLAGFRHVHPRMDPDGTWRIVSPLGAPGSWRAFADFVPTGAEPLTLGVDVAVPGAFAPRALPAPAATATVDGYTVHLTGELRPGGTNELTLTVHRDGVPVTDLQPYLGAYGHLVALRQGDLAYLHVHPQGAPGDGRTRPGPEVRFRAEVPSAGTYRLFLDFRHGDTVRTAEFTVVAGASDHAHD
ncbi:hypothetical protein [Micromonospora sp. NPDC023956]|uniref:hypothetical protein n=1 Tax=Micromonospora sp. NPDC023956 TaxID=3155722 RepID=UPI0033DC81FB